MLLSDFYERAPDVHDVGGGRSIMGEMLVQVTNQPLFAVAGFSQPTAKGERLHHGDLLPERTGGADPPEGDDHDPRTCCHERWLTGSYYDVVALQRLYDATG